LTDINYEEQQRKPDDGTEKGTESCPSAVCHRRLCLPYVTAACLQSI